jgi:hypothetical protein
MVIEGLVVNGSMLVWGRVWPAFSVGWEEPMWDGDSGFSVLLQDAPDPGDVERFGNPLDHPLIRLEHVGYVLELNPALGEGLLVAREYGAADLDGGVWVGRSVD